LQVAIGFGLLSDSPDTRAAMEHRARFGLVDGRVQRVHIIARDRADAKVAR
jgi:hypothetical protein